MNVKGMLPLPLAFEIEREVYDFLDVSFEIKATKVGDALRKYYTKTNPLVKGPFVKISLPYEATSSKDDSPLGLKTSFPPYKHQLKAFERLQFAEPKNTIVTTGTGSGKTECFVYPVLDYVKSLKEKSEGEKGIKAIILYPMNALLDDQAIRFIKTIKEHGLQDLDIRVGKYTGNHGRNRSMNWSKNEVIDHRDELISNPPDVLLTNYKMLDYMLFRDQEKNFWNDRTKKVLKYLVLDEMHTFDGAQGSDVACLIRRLKSVSDSSENLAFVGTSATLSSSENAKQELCEFASTLFGSEFNEDSIVQETKHTVESYLGKPDQSLESIWKNYEAKDNLGYVYGDSIDEHVKKVLNRFNADELFDNPENVSELISSFKLFQEIVSICSAETLPFDEIINKLRESNQDYVKLDESPFRSIVEDFITLASFARHKSIKDFPFLSIKINLWTSELRNLLAKVVDSDEEAVFIDEDEKYDLSEMHLPAVYCSKCGETGYATVYTENEDVKYKHLLSDPRKIKIQHLRNKGCVLFPVNTNLADHDPESDDIHFLYRKERKLSAEDDGVNEDLDDKPIPVAKALVKEGRCPACDSKLNTRYYSLGASSLTSIVSTSLFSHPLNKDQKIIAFSDSIQDASHQAAFLNNRSYSFSFKRYLSPYLTVGMKLSEAQKSIVSDERFKDMQPLEKVDFVGRFAPDRLQKKWRLSGIDQSQTVNDDMVKSLKTVIEYNAFSEFTLSSKLGWSFEKVGYGGFFIDPKLWKALMLADRREWVEPDSTKLSMFLENNIFEQFILGFLQRLKTTGCVNLELMELYYKDPKADYYTSSRRHPDLPIGDFKLSRPRFFSSTMSGEIKKRRNFETIGSKTSWYSKWLSKFTDTPRVMNFYEGLCSWLLDNNILVDVRDTSGNGKPRYVIDSNVLSYSSGLEHYECDTCKTKSTAPSSMNESIQGSPCLQRFCSGKMNYVEKKYSKDYFERYFSQDALRIHASEHTGSFDSKLKKVVEDEFKKKETHTPNFDTNFLSCTPTMEMGIDIGDLSIVLLKSVPRNAASYLQRIGRSGRTTGNSFDLLTINRRAHNQYFWLAPSELLNWEVRSPSCHYKTGHILKRQFNAFCLDQYLHFSNDENIKVLPNSFKWLSGEDRESSEYWDGFFNYVNSNSERLFKSFANLFQLKSAEDAYEQLNNYSKGNGLTDSFEDVFEIIREEINILKKNESSLVDEINKLNSSESGFYEKIRLSLEAGEEKAYDNLIYHLTDEAKSSLEDLLGNISSVQKKGRALLDPRQTNLLSELANYGVLPGYAFPEQGCELSFNIRRPSRRTGQEVKDPFYTLSVSRPPESALSELAPFNSFYTHGFKAKIDRLGIYGKDSPFVKLGTCQMCGNVSNQNICNVCNSAIELNYSFDFKRAMATTSFERSYVNDANEGRERENYVIERKFLFDTPITNNDRKVVSFFNEETHFGYEFQTNVDIYSFNEGTSDFGTDPKPFLVCKSCGAVKDPKDQKRRKEKGLPVVNHYKSCAGKDYELVPVILHRKIQSDAVRIPIANHSLAPLLKAILKLGVETYLKGDTGHITVSSYNQSLVDGNAFLVLFDNVPGGTGHLRDLFDISLDDSKQSGSPKRFLEILRLVLEHIQDCPCDDGCYHCVWNAENISHKDKVSKKGAIFHLNRLLAQKPDDFEQKIEGLLEISKLHSFDGHTEAMLFHSLNVLKSKITVEDYRFSLDEVDTNSEFSKWKVNFKDGECFLVSSPEDKVKLKDSGSYTKPDFKILNDENKIVAFIYTDGARFHLNPGDETCKLEEDFSLRHELSKQEKVPVLTFTYKELDNLWLFLSETEELNTIESCSFNTKIFDDGKTKGEGNYLTNDSSSRLLISVLLRALRKASGIDEDLSIDELSVDYLSWARDYSSEFLKGGSHENGLLLEIRTDIDARTEDSGFNTVPYDYYLDWITFWQMVNISLFCPPLRGRLTLRATS